MGKLIFNLQWFADAGTLLNATDKYRNAYDATDVTEFVTGVTDLSPLNKTFWDTALLDNARDELVYTQLGKKVSLPANHGRTIEFRRWKRLADLGVLTEGVIPTGKKMSIVAITVSLSQYGDYVAITDILDAHGIEDTKLGAVEELGAAGGLTLEKTVRNTLMGSTNIIFADAMNGTTYVSTPSDEAGLQTALGSYTCNLTARMINKAATQLQKGAQMVKYSGGYYVAVVHPDVAEDIRNDSAWIEAHKYAAVEEIMNGEIGRMHGVRFLVSNLAPVIKKTSPSQTYATYKTFFFAKDAFAVIDPEGGSMETIIKDKDQIGGPLNQFMTVGCKFETASKILYQERMVTVWSGSSYSATETTNVA